MASILDSYISEVSVDHSMALNADRLQSGTCQLKGYVIISDMGEGSDFEQETYKPPKSV